MKKIALGESDFKTIIDKNLYFVDKSLLIKDIFEDSSQITLIPRPRRFGKTLNLSMIKYFVQKSEQNNRYLFNNLLIEKEEEVIKKQGIYPTIYLTFKDERHNDISKLIERMGIFISGIYKEFYEIHDNLKYDEDKDFFMRAINRKLSIGELELSLKNLCKYANDYYGEKVIILIDEYDTPIQYSYFSGIYDETINFMRNFLANTLKDNINLEKSVLTGILRVAKESIFSGLNNLDVCTILSDRYSDKFGFTEKEVEEVLDYFNQSENSDKFRSWYNGYNFGQSIIYNPWSTLSYLKSENKEFIPYWVNTSENKIIKTILAKGSESLKKSFEELLRGNIIEAIIDENIIMSDIELSENSIWSFLLFSGYLKVIEKRYEIGELYCKLAIPNTEVKSMYNKIVKDWAIESYISSEYNEMLRALINFDFKVFKKIFARYVRESFSYFDITGKLPENTYHAFTVGLLVSLNQTHQVLSNRESGYGRYDVMIIPRDISKIGIIIEFKKYDDEDEETLEELIEEAKNQIEDKKYETELLDRGITNIKKMVIVFKGKQVWVNDVTNSTNK